MADAPGDGPQPLPEQLIYMLLRLEDNALLVGALASFAAVAVAMYFTRNLDWYGSLPERAAQPGNGK